jgi:hypothetical protein
MGHRLPCASLVPFGFAVEAVRIIGEFVEVRVRSRSLSAACPDCGRSSRRIKAEMSGDLLTYLSAAGG